MPNRNGKASGTTTGRRLIVTGQKGSKKVIKGAGSAVVASHYLQRGNPAKVSDSTLITDMALVGPKVWCFVQLVTSSLTPSQAQDVALSTAEALGVDYSGLSVTRYGDAPRERR